MPTSLSFSDEIPDIKSTRLRSFGVDVSGTAWKHRVHEGGGYLVGGEFDHGTGACKSTITLVLIRPKQHDGAYGGVVSRRALNVVTVFHWKQVFCDICIRIF